MQNAEVCGKKKRIWKTDDLSLFSILEVILRLHNLARSSAFHARYRLFHNLQNI